MIPYNAVSEIRSEIRSYIYLFFFFCFEFIWIMTYRYLPFWCNMFVYVIVFCLVCFLLLTSVISEEEPQLYFSILVLILLILGILIWFLVYSEYCIASCENIIYEKIYNAMWDEIWNSEKTHVVRHKNQFNIVDELFRVTVLMFIGISFCIWMYYGFEV